MSALLLPTDPQHPLLRAVQTNSREVEIAYVILSPVNVIFMLEFSNIFLMFSFDFLRRRNEK